MSKQILIIVLVVVIFKVLFSLKPLKSSFAKVNDGALTPIRATRKLLGPLIGIGLIAISLYLTVWNEKGIFDNNQICDTIEAEVVDLSTKAPNDGDLVFISGKIKTESPLVDSKYGITSDCLILERVLRIYRQHTGHRTVRHGKVRHGKVRHSTTVNRKKWVKPFKSVVLVPDYAMFRDYLVIPDIFKGIEYQQYFIEEMNDAAGKFKLYNGELFISDHPSFPKDGDIKINYECVKAGDYSFIAIMKDNVISPYVLPPSAAIAWDKCGISIRMPVELVKTGTYSLDQFLKSIRSENDQKRWLIRAATYILVIASVFLIILPLNIKMDLLENFGFMFKNLLLSFCLGSLVYLIFITTSSYLYGMVLLR